MHDQLIPLARLVGLWRGTGTASYPTMDDFDYTDEITFTDIGKPFLVYQQRTWAADGRVMHVECGYLRATGEGRVEFVVAIPSGQSELGGGELSVDDAGLYISTDAPVQCTPTAKRVDRIVRSYHASGDTLRYDMAMAAVGVGITTHLRAELTRG